MKITPDGVRPLTFALEIAVILTLEAATVLAIALVLIAILGLFGIGGGLEGVFA